MLRGYGNMTIITNPPNIEIDIDIEIVTIILNSNLDLQIYNL